MLQLWQARSIATHFTPDLDAAMSRALAETRYPRLISLPTIFLPAGDLTKDQVRSHEEQGTVFLDVGGPNTGRDHHSSGKRISAARIIANEVGLNHREFAGLLDFIDGNDQQGANFRYFIKNGGGTLPANDLVINCLIRGASHVRYNPLNPKVSLQEQGESYRRLARLCRLIINRVGSADQGASFSSEARILLQHSLTRAIAKSLDLVQPNGFDGFENTLDFLNRLNGRKWEDRGYRCQEDPNFNAFIKMMGVTPLKLIIQSGNKGRINDPKTLWLAESLTLLGIAQQLIVENQIPQRVKLVILRDCWLNLFAYQTDWLKALGDLKNGGIKYASEIKGWQVVAIESDCSRIGQASRHVCAENPVKHNVIIVRRSNGQVQITCQPQLHLVPKVKQAIVNLRKKEAAIRGLDIPAEELAAEEELVAGWYIPHFGGGLNGSLTNPTVESTRLDLKTIYQTVCLALWQ